MEEVANTSGATIMLMSAPSQHDFKWTHERCMLLLHEYDLLKDKFKDRKHKKKDLWAEISMKFKKIYEYDLEWDVAYKKFRNLKQTFEQVRAKLKQQAITGQYSNRPKWPYFEKFQQILEDPGVVSYSYVAEQHHQLQQNHHDEEDDTDDHHHHHPHHHRHHHHKHPAHLDPATVGQVLAGEDFSDTLVAEFPMGEELEIPAQQVEECSEQNDDDHATVDQKELVVQTVLDSEEDQDQGGEEEEEEQVTEHIEEEEKALAQQTEELEEESPPHRKRFRRLSAYEQERLMIEREKLETLREIQRGIECKNDILRGILHVLQSRVWQAHPPMD
ncbi:hormone receptor 4-like [Anopheles maculipalpis]|uniref:hormone receptor 4-like n=1 Tax=Anopheles maculipalpis TaxID=1496333 RepID=UPI002158E45E|nr:hormone receptor 4-like [Anopheles maculipalpis]